MLGLGLDCADKFQQVALLIIQHNVEDDNAHSKLISCEEVRKEAHGLNSPKRSDSTS